MGAAGEGGGREAQDVVRRFRERVCGRDSLLLEVLEGFVNKGLASLSYELAVGNGEEEAKLVARRKLTEFLEYGGASGLSAEEREQLRSELLRMWSIIEPRALAAAKNYAAMARRLVERKYRDKLVGILAGYLVAEALRPHDYDWEVTYSVNRELGMEKLMLRRKLSRHGLLDAMLKEYCGEGEAAHPAAAPGGQG